ncbi:Colicin V production protein [Candidatus Ecksteinia adelgidicola]|nr:Colicin V production protein [Candidatus Ecksteinia adelgidicola]
MVWIDYTIILMITCSALVSFIRGFIQEVLSLLTWIGSFFITSRAYLRFSMYLTYFKDEIIRNSISIIILFVTTLIFGTISNCVINALIKNTKLSSTDRILGICFGMLRGILIVSVILFFIDAYTSLPQSTSWKKSLFITHFGYIITWSFKFLKNTFIFFIKY